MSTLTMETLLFFEIQLALKTEKAFLEKQKEAKLNIIDFNTNGNRKEIRFRKNESRKIEGSTCRHKERKWKKTSDENNQVDWRCYRFGSRNQHAYSLYQTKNFMFLLLLLALSRKYT